MTPRLLALALALSTPLVLGACSSSDDDAPTSPPVEEPGGEPPPAEPATLLDEGFDDATGAALPEGWRQVTGLVNAASQQAGSLVIDGLANESVGTAVALPASLATQGNYRIDVRFTIDSAKNTSRWVGFLYRTSDTPNLEPYTQMAVRQNATADNGTELAHRADGQWNVTDKAPFSENIDPAKTYTATVVVHGNRVRQYLDGTLLHDGELDDTRPVGGLALQATGAVLRVDHVTVKAQEEALPPLGQIFAVTEPETGASLAPTLVGSDPAQAGIANNQIMTLDASLNLHAENGESLGTLAAFLDKPGHAIPVLRLGDAATAKALVPFADARGLIDATLVSTDPALLTEARALLPRLRTALDFTQAGLGNTRNELLSIVHATNRSGSKIALVPPALLDRDAVAYLQDMLITVWAAAVDDGTAARAATVLASGVNGIVTGEAQTYADLLGKLPDGTLLRKPRIVGHRGIPGLEDENTLEGAIRAYEEGADTIESDIQLSTDGTLYIMHDGTVDRTTTSTGEFEAMSDAQIQALVTKPNGRAVPTLEAFFNEFKGKPVTHFVEIKTNKSEAVDALHALVDAHGVRDQLVVISFSQSQLKRLRERMPEVSAGFLTGVPTGTDTQRIVRQILTNTQALSSTFNPSYNNLTPAILEAAKHRGTTFWPWTYRDEAIARAHYRAGTYGLTTDDAQWFGGYAARVDLPAQATVPVGQLALAGTLLRQDRKTEPLKATRYVVVESTAPYAQDGDGSLTFTGTGTATVLALHTHDQGDGQGYTLLSTPVMLTVQ
ncbi:Glycerophosphoryl diester phosphodiesterase [plant metagenome]|uniref:Glycerophosphoryl diester phosphodiesterase n=1 Tax=plant metagenome TaxID=1297885 RepID=A0A484NXK4_9ZZZZ